jgi:hypothetical protein
MGCKFVLLNNIIVWPAALVLIHKRLDCIFILERQPGMLTIVLPAVHINKFFSQTVHQFLDSRRCDGELGGHRERSHIPTVEYHWLEALTR